MPRADRETSSRLIDALKIASRLLESQGVAHALLGGMAANLYRREARATQDVDLGVVASPAELVLIIEAFRNAGWAPEVRSGKAEALRLAHADLPRIDLLIAGTPFEEAAIGRAAKLTIDGQEMTIVTPEDLIVYKLIAGRARDYEAVAAILNMSDSLSEIDSAYVRGWLDQFGLGERWARAEDEARLMADDA
jgi:predicted nucleotidyltransferase